MPSVSGAQHGAMCAACAGHGKAGIPHDVGCEYCHADKGKKFSVKRVTVKSKPKPPPRKVYRR